MIACYYNGHDDIAKMLIDAGADKDHQAKDGRTACTSVKIRCG